LFFTNFLTGEAATIDDLQAPLVTDDAGTVLPVPSFHALDSDSGDGFNFLNPAAGVQAVELEPSALGENDAAGGEATVLGFEDLLTTDPSFDGDFNDAVVAVSATPVATDLANNLLGDLESTNSEAAIA
jgi:hypothetical protein